MSHSRHNLPPLIKELSEQLKEPMETITSLQHMKTLEQKLPLPTIVVLGETGACVASVVSTLVGLNLPSGLVVPLVLRFAVDSVPSRKIRLEFHFEQTHCEKDVSEAVFASEIEKLVKQVPEDERYKAEVTLIVVQPDVSDLMIVLLPEIHTYPKPSLSGFTSLDHDMYMKEKKEIELYKGYIDRYATLKDHLFLNVLSCPSDFDSCLSRKIIKEHDPFGKRSVTIFTKLDLSSEYMIEHLTSKNTSKAPFGYFFVDHKTKDDEKTRKCDLLTKVDKNYIGFDVISKNLVMAMLSILFGERSIILKSVEDDLEKSTAEIKHCQRTFDSLSDAIPEILSILNSVSINLRKLFIEQDYKGYWKDERMHAASNIAKRIKRFRINLQDLKLDREIPFLQHEIKLLTLDSESWFNISKFYSRGNIMSLLNDQLSFASITIDDFASNIMDYIEDVVVRVFLDCSEEYQQFRQLVRRAGRVLVKGVRQSFEEKIEEMLDMEKKCFYTCSGDVSRLVDEMKPLKLDIDGGKEFIDIDGLGKNIKVDHLKGYPANKIEKAYEMKYLVLVYWELVVHRFVDYCYLNLQSLIHKMTSDGIEKLLKEHIIKSIEDGNKLPNVEPGVAFNKRNMENRTESLMKAKKEIKKWQIARS